MVSRLSPKSWLSIKLHRHRGALPTPRRKAKKAAAENQKTKQRYISYHIAGKQEPVCSLNPVKYLVEQKQ